MANRTPWLAAAAAVIAIVVALLLWRGCRPAPPAGPPADFASETANLVSPDLDLEMVSVKGVAHPAYTDWACLLACRESRGCRADVKLEILYRSGGEKRSLIIGGRLEGDTGQTMRIGRVQRPATAVDRIDQVTVTVVAAVKPGAPRPTPII
jgi:hypothetical protein